MEISRLDSQHGAAAMKAMRNEASHIFKLARSVCELSKANVLLPGLIASFVGIPANVGTVLLNEKADQGQAKCASERLLS